MLLELLIEDLVIYEMHVRGESTRHNLGVGMMPCG
jgi:pullulanase/glycogen debranching enzyme